MEKKMINVYFEKGKFLNCISVKMLMSFTLHMIVEQDSLSHLH